MKFSTVLSIFSLVAAAAALPTEVPHELPSVDTILGDETSSAVPRAAATAASSSNSVSADTCSKNNQKITCASTTDGQALLSLPNLLGQCLLGADQYCCDGDVQQSGFLNVAALNLNCLKIL